MKPRTLSFVLAPVFVLSAAADTAPPEKALRYHEALLKRPQNTTLFDRFFSAWIDEQPIETLEAFLILRAETSGGDEWSVLARYQLRRGHEDAALNAFAKAMEAAPDDPYPPMESARILLRRLDFEAARKELAKVTAGSDETLAAEAAKLIGRSWLREGKSAEAIKVWDELLAANPGDEDLLEDLVESAAAEGEHGQALAYVEKLIAASSDPYKKTQRSLRRGDLLAQAGRQDEAVEAYAATLGQVGEGSWLEREVLAQIDKLFRKQDRLDDLAAEMKKLADAHPGRLMIHRQLAKLEASQGETDTAIGRFREVLKRSPGDRELREEFVRLLTDAEAFDDAALELDKMIAAAPQDAALQLQMAALRHRQENQAETLAALEKAHALIGEDEAGGIRIAGLMFQYGLGGKGEAILKKLAAAEGAGPAPFEALAAEYGRTNRKDEAIELLEQISASGDAEVVMRATASMSALGGTDAAFVLLESRAAEFSSEPRFLSSLVHSALAAGHADKAVAHAVRLVRMSKQSGETGENVGLATRVITAADKTGEWFDSLSGQETLSPAETCLLAALAEGRSDYETVDKLFGKASDPLLVRFHAAILDRRGEFDSAITALSRLADTDEGRKAAYFKDLSELQQRAGKTNDALATLERWKQSVPGDKTPWITASRLLRESGRLEDALKMTRLSVSRFDGDEDLTATLASLHEESSQWADAEAIYWRLYDGAQSASDQVRWAGRLAQLALQTSRFDELDEKLRERARGNRRSIGPILAQAELARVLQNDEKRRDLLLEAVRLQPKDIELRLQIAGLEEQSGNAERGIAILEEAASDDSTGRIRSALAQAYLRSGEIMKGVRELRALSGNKADEPRTIENSAASLAGAGLYDEAIRFLRESLPDGGDWRTKYLLAVMLEHDGREAEALPLFLSLLQAEGEISGLSQAGRQNPFAMAGYPEDVRSIYQLSMASMAAYSHAQSQNQRYRFSGMSMTGPFSLPEDAENVRLFSLLHLARLAVNSGDAKETLLSQIRSLGENHIDFIIDFSANPSPGQINYSALLAKYPAHPGLLETVLLSRRYGQEQDLTPEIVKAAIEQGGQRASRTLFQAKLYLAESADADSPAWEDLITSAREAVDNENIDEALESGHLIIHALSAKQSPIPEKHETALKQILLDLAAKNPGGDGGANHAFNLFAHAIAGPREQWIASLNQEITAYRKNQAASTQGLPQEMQMILTQLSRLRGYNPWMMHQQNPFILPTIEQLTFQSLPAEWLVMIRKSDAGDILVGFPAIPPEELIGPLDQVESPLLRAWISLQAGDEEAITKHLAATPPEVEAVDFNLLLACRAAEQKEFVEAYRLMEKSRPALAGDREKTRWLNNSLVAIATEMTGEEREGIKDSLRTVLLQCRQALGTQGSSMLAEKARQLGHEDLAKRFQPPAAIRAGGATTRLGPAGIGSSSRSGQAAAAGSIERLNKFTIDKKFEAAAREALLLYRKASQNTWNSRREIRELVTATTEEVRAELLKQTDPGDSKSLTRRLEFADICLAFGKKEPALVILEALHAERPNDGTVAGKLAFQLPPEDRDRAAELINIAAGSDTFLKEAGDRVRGFSYDSDVKEVFDFFETITVWLENAEPEKLSKANLTWVAYSAKSFFSGNMANELDSLISENHSNKGKSGDSEKHAQLGKRLALAMVRHPSISEEGFRLLSASKAWTLPPAEMDAHARQALIAIRPNHRGYGGSNFFSLIIGTGSSSSGEDLDSDSSVKWIVSRLDETKNPDEILPPDFFKQLEEQNPGIAPLVKALIHLDTIAQLEALLDSDEMKNPDQQSVSMLKNAVLAKAGGIKDGSAFFLKRIREIPRAKSPAMMGHPAQNSELILLGAALTAASGGSDQELHEICEAVSHALFGEKIDWNPKDGGMMFLSRLQQMEHMMRTLTLEPKQVIRLLRAFHHLDTPVATSDYTLLTHFRKSPVASAGEAEKLFESYGWLADIHEWEPVAAILVNTEHNAGRITFNREETLLNERVFSYMNTRFSRSDLVKNLKNRKPQTFGSLITAASITSGKERADLTAAAFTAAGPELAKLPQERLDRLALLVPWLPADAATKLPPAFRGKIDSINQERLKELRKHADAFLAKQQNTFGSHNNPFNETKENLAPLATLDSEKFLEVFLEAERRFTESLTRGGNLSSYASDDLSITERDEAISQLVSQSDSPLANAPEEALRFISALMKAPEGGRFSLSASGHSSNTLLQDAGEIILNASGSEDWHPAMKLAHQMPEDIRQNALLAVTSHNIQRNSINERSAADRARKHLETLKDTPGEMIALQRLVIGIQSWMHDSIEQRKATSDALAGLLGDESISENARIQLAFTCLAKQPAVLTDPAIAEAFTARFENYCRAERSVVNRIVLNLFKSIATSAAAPGTEPFMQRINHAFWENANARKAGGHPEIPEKSLPDLFMVSARFGDEASTKKLLTLSRQGVIGELRIIAALIGSGQHELALSVFPGDKNEYSSQGTLPSYDRVFEEHFAAFPKDKLTPLQLLRLECQFLKLPAGRNEQAPRESQTERALRLGKTFTGLDLEPGALRTNLLQSIIVAHPFVALEMKDEVFKAADGIDHQAAVRDWMAANNSTPTSGRALEASNKCFIHSVAASMALYHGDHTRLEKVLEVITSNTSRDGRHSLQAHSSQVIRTISIWSVMAIAKGQTQGMEASLDSLEKYALHINGSPDMNWYSAFGSLTLCQFISHWRNEPERFKKLLEKAEDKQNAKKQFRYDWSLLHYADRANQHFAWNTPEMTEMKKQFLIASFTRPEMAGYFPQDKEWLDHMHKKNIRSELLAVVTNPPENLLPGLRAPLLYHLAKEQLKEQPQEAIETFRRAVEASLPGKESDRIRNICRQEFASALHHHKRPDEAREVLATIEKEHLPEWYKKHYDHLVKTLGKPEQP